MITEGRVKGYFSFQATFIDPVSELEYEIYIRVCSKAGCAPKNYTFPILQDFDECSCLAQTPRKINFCQLVCVVARENAQFSQIRY